MRETRSDRASSRDVDNGALQSLVAVAIDKDKGSQAALRWTVDNLMEKGQTLFLVHVKHKSSQSHSDEIYNREIFLPFRCYCTRKDVQCKDICLDGPDIAKSIVEFVSQNAVDKLVVSAPSKSTFIRFKSTDVSSSVSKGAPDFCTVYIISKGKVSSTRKAIRQAPAVSPLRTELESQKQKQGLSQASGKPDLANPPLPNRKSVGSPMFRSFEDSTNNIRSPFSRGGNHQSYSDISLCETDISFVSSGRPSSDRMFPSLFDDMEPQHRPPRLSNCSEQSFELMRTPRKSTDMQMIGSEYSGFSQSSSSMSWSSQNISMDEAELEMRRLKLELKQTMDMYNTACREALNAKQKAGELHRWKVEEEQKMQEARMAEETALAIAERERAKCRAAVEAAEASRRIAKLEEQKRMTAEMMAQKENEERKKVESAGVGVGQSNLMYRRYTIEEIEIATDYFAASRKVGEGGYGPVFKCYLDHTMAAVKVLRPDAAQGRSQFQQEVEVLSCIRHPNMVLLLGACPEYGCLVYEYLSNGSLEDRLFCKGNTPVLPWQLRFRIAAEIATGLLFLHQTKPEPLVHRDLKPANILLDRNFVSKISDVGLARLVPASVADSVTQYRMTSTAGTFCYIDPEYQQTGMLGTKSDVYSLGIMLLQIITAKPAMGLAHHAQAAIDNSTFHKFLDPAIPDWPLEEALRFAKIAIQCAELRRKDRPDLGLVVLPELNRLREFADAHSYSFLPGIGSLNPSPVHSGASMKSEDMSGPMNTTFESESGSSSFPDKQTGIP